MTTFQTLVTTIYSWISSYTYNVEYCPGNVKKTPHSHNVCGICKNVTNIEYLVTIDDTNSCINCLEYGDFDNYCLYNDENV